MLLEIWLLQVPSKCFLQFLNFVDVSVSSAFRINTVSLKHS